MAGKKTEVEFASGVKKLGDAELNAELSSHRTKLFSLRSQSVTDKVEDTSQFGIAKRNIARILTEQNARRKASASK